MRPSAQKGPYLLTYFLVRKSERTLKVIIQSGTLLRLWNKSACSGLEWPQRKRLTFRNNQRKIGKGMRAKG